VIAHSFRGGRGRQVRVRTAVLEYLPGMIRDWALDLVIVNGENSAGGFGITEAIYQEFIDAGADAVTARQSCLGPARGAGVHRARAAAGSSGEFSKGHAGPRLGAGRHQNGKRALVVNAIGRVFMTPFDDRSPRSTANSKPARCARRRMPS